MHPDKKHVNIRTLPKESYEQARALFRDCGLPVNDLTDRKMRSFLCAMDDNGTMLGVAGLEIAGTVGSLLGVAVHPDHREGGLCQFLINMAERTANVRGAESLFVLTETERALYADRAYAEPKCQCLPALVADKAKERPLACVLVKHFAPPEPDTGCGCC